MMDIYHQNIIKYWILRELESTDNRATMTYNTKTQEFVSSTKIKIEQWNWNVIITIILDPNAIQE